MGIVWRSEMVLQAVARLRRLHQAAERAEAMVLFALQGKRRTWPLSEEQLQRYDREGCLLVSGLVPQNLVMGAETAMWQLLGADAQEPRSWAILGPRPHVLRDGRFVAIYTDALLAAAAQLAGVDVAGFRRPTHAFTVNNVPVYRDWRPHPSHLDQTIPELRIRTFPRPYWIAAIIYLTDVQPHGGGTIVWPGSHLRLEARARADPEKYKYLSALNIDLGQMDLDLQVELTPSRGDVLFHHYLCAHASSDNVRGAPRLAITHKW
jgi:hypothetical protein